jgi:hypothetical protein
VRRTFFPFSVTVQNIRPRLTAPHLIRSAKGDLHMCELIDVIETGNEPEFLIHELPKWEDAGDGFMRVLVSSFRGNAERSEYWAICTPERLTYICRKGLIFAEEAKIAMRDKVRRIGH